MAERDPLVGFQYMIEVSGVITGYFTECSGLGSENELIEHKVIDDKGVEHIQMIPGRLKWDQIKLKRGITDNMDIWDWRKMVEDGKMKGRPYERLCHHAQPGTQSGCPVGL